MTALRRHAAMCLLAAGLGFVVHAPALRGGFLWDDETLIAGNPRVRAAPSPAVLGEALSPAFPRYYRPLQVVSYQLDNAVWGMRPRGFHFTNVLLHSLNAALVYAAACAAGVAGFAAGWAAVLFAVHPLHAEPVNYISSRSDLLCALFLLLAFNAFARMQRDPRVDARFYACASAFVFALLSKESALVFPLIAAAYAYVLRKPRTFVVAAAALGGIAAAYALIRAAWLFPPVQGGGPGGAALTSLALTDAHLVRSYVQLLLAPAGLHKNWLVPLVASWGDARVLQALVSAGGACAFWAGFMRRHRGFLFGGLWFFIALIPASSFLMLTFAGVPGPVSHVLLSESWVYTASAGFFLCAGSALERLVSFVRRPIVCGLAAVIALSYSAITLQRGFVWSGDAADFYREVVRYHPGNASVRYNLANELARRGGYAAAIAEYRAALFLNPAHVYARSNLCRACVETGDAACAAAECSEALRLRPDLSAAHYNLGRAYELQGDAALAREVYERALSRRPDFHEARERLEKLR